MERINIERSLKETKCPHFIGTWNIGNNALCKKIIGLFEENKNLQHAGVTGKGVNLLYKKTSDITVILFCSE